MTLVHTADSDGKNQTPVSASNGLPVAAVYNSTLPTYTTGQVTVLQAGTRGSLNVSLFAADSTNAATVTTAGTRGASASSIGLTTRGFSYAFNGATWDMAAKPSSVSRLPSAAASTNATSAKASAGEVHSISAYNAAGAGRYLKLYNKATAPTVGTDTPVATFYLPAGANFTLNIPNGGLYFSTGIAYAMTTGAADADTGALTAADVLGLNIAYS